MCQNFYRWRCLKVVVAGFLLALSVVAIASVPTIAQEQPASEAAAAGEPAAESAPREAAPAEEGAPAFPAGLDDPDIGLDELEIRVLPLTVGELAALADAWQLIVRSQAQDVVDATIAANGGDTAPTQEELDRLVELTETRGDGFARFGAVVDNLEKKGGDEAAVASFRAYEGAILVEEKQRAGFRALVALSLNWVISEDGGLEVAGNILVVVLALAGLVLVARVVRSYARRLFRRVPDLSKLLQAFLTMVVYWVTIAVGLMIVLSALGVDVSPLFAVVGGASFIIAFAMQDTLGNLASGLMIMFNRPFDEGDYVTAAGTSGTVKSVSVVSTTVTTPDNQVIVIPNSKVWGDVITNTTASEVRRVDMVFGIGYDDSIEEAQQVLEDIVRSHPGVLNDPAPVIRVGALADSSVNFIVRPWTRREDYWNTLWDITRTVKEAFDAHGISIPFPQTEMHLNVQGGSLPVAAAEVPGSETRGSGSGVGGRVDTFSAGGDGEQGEGSETA